MGVDQAHRAGSLKQSNKAHKTGRHRSKGAIDNELKGMVFVVGSGGDGMSLETIYRIV